MTNPVRFLLQVVLLGCGALLVIDDEITPGAIVAASMLMARAPTPLETTIGAWRQCVGVRAAYARLNELLRRSPPRPKRISLPAPRGALRVEDVVAWLPGSTEPILRGVNFNLAAGHVPAVVGASGSGKSTLARLIVGALPPYAGKVCLDNADIQLWNRQELGPYPGYLPQEVELFEGTIAGKHCPLWQPTVQDRKAAQRAAVHDIVLGLPQGAARPGWGRAGNAFRRTAAAHRAGAGDVRRSGAGGSG